MIKCLEIYSGFIYLQVDVKKDGSGLISKCQLVEIRNCAIYLLLPSIHGCRG
jgi:hypothetical protein